MEVLDNVGFGGKCVDVVREQGVRRYGQYGCLIGALELHVVESVVGVAPALPDGRRVD